MRKLEIRKAILSHEEEGEHATAMQVIERSARLLFPWTADYTAHLAATGCLDALDDVVNNGIVVRCPLVPNTMVQAINHGRIEVVEWLLRHKCPYNEHAYHAAARRGDIQIMNMLRRQPKRPSWNETVTYLAAENGHDEMFEWLLGQQPPCPADLGGCTEARNRFRRNVQGN